MNSPAGARQTALAVIDEALDAAGISSEPLVAEPVAPPEGGVSPAYLLVTEDAYAEAVNGYDVTVSITMLAHNYDDLSVAFAAVYTALELSSVTLRYDGFTGTEGAGNLVGGVESYVVEGV